MKVLVADSSTSEFGWELMTWQARVRLLAPKFDRVIVCTTAGMEPLYADCANEYITHSVHLDRDCYKTFKIHDKKGWDRYRKRVDTRVGELKRKGHEVKFVRHDKNWKLKDQQFIKYGDADSLDSDSFDILLHARNKESKNPYYRVYNWPVPRWNKVVSWLRRQGLTVAAVGTKGGAFLPADAVDLRGIPLNQLMNHMDACELVIGPSSGPMHLASLCGAPHFVWTGREYSTTINAYNIDRYRTVWNPLDTWCHVIDRNPDLTADEVIKELDACMAKYGGT